jgi:hypothetical protein
MHKSVVFVVLALVGTFAAPLALMRGLAASATVSSGTVASRTVASTTAASGGIPVQLVIVWVLLGVIALGLTFAVLRMVRAR